MLCELLVYSGLHCLDQRRLPRDRTDRNRTVRKVSSLKGLQSGIKSIVPFLYELIHLLWGQPDIHFSKLIMSLKGLL